MEAPFGITFLKKAELFNLTESLDKQAKEMGINRDVENPPLWPVEKAILRWTYLYHKHLGSPISTDHLSSGSQWRKLDDFGMIDKAGKLKKEFRVLEKIPLQKPLENLVVRGFATYLDESQFGHNQIVINKEGLLLGEVLAELGSGPLFVKINYWVYSKLMDHPGALLLLVLTIIGILKALGILRG